MESYQSLPWKTKFDILVEKSKMWYEQVDYLKLLVVLKLCLYQIDIEIMYRKYKSKYNSYKWSTFWTVIYFISITKKWLVLSIFGQHFLPCKFSFFFFQKKRYYRKRIRFCNHFFIKMLQTMTIILFDDQFSLLNMLKSLLGLLKVGVHKGWFLTL